MTEYALGVDLPLSTKPALGDEDRALSAWHLFPLAPHLPHADNYLHLGLTMLVNEVISQWQEKNGVRFASRRWVLEYEASDERCCGSGGSHWKIVGALPTGIVSVTIPYGCSLSEARRLLRCALASAKSVVSTPTASAVAERALFSPREIIVLQYLRRGISQTQCAVMLGVSAKTVNYYKQRAMKTLGFKSNRQLQFWLLGSACFPVLAED